VTDVFNSFVVKAIISWDAGVFSRLSSTRAVVKAFVNAAYILFVTTK
jgi:hypothetical protein